MSRVGLSGTSRPWPPLPALDAQHHPLAVDVATFSCKQLAAAQARAVERHEHRAVIEILRAGDEAPDFVGTEDGRAAGGGRFGSAGPPSAPAA